MLNIVIAGLAASVTVVTIVTITSMGMPNGFPIITLPTGAPLSTEETTEQPTEAQTEPPTEVNKLYLYPLNNQFIGYYESEVLQQMKEKKIVEAKSGAFFQTIIVMDISGSMGGQVKRLIQQIFPLLFKKLSYQPSEQIHLITFSSTSKLQTLRVDEFPASPIVSGGNTLMTQAVLKCQEVFQILDSNKPVRLLTISDGEIQDQPQTAAQAVLLNNFLNRLNPRFLINSNAIRLFTSTAQPDTTAISSLLQTNNGPSNSLRDISAAKENEEIAQEIADFFLTDNFDKLRTITVSNPIFKEFPWDNQTTSAIKLSPGENIFWITEFPDGGFDDNGTSSEAVLRSSLNADQFEVLIRIKFDVIVEKIKILQILDSIDSKATIEHIKQYFSNMLQLLPVGQRTVSEMAVFIEIDKLASDQSVKNMTPQEKADYLQTKIILPPLET